MQLACARLAGLALSLSCAVACNPKTGFESAADAVDPSEKSYVDGPGSLLTAGPFDSVGFDFDPDTDVHLLARRRDDQHQSLTIFGQDAQSGCTIAPDVATWFVSKPATQPYRLLPFLDAFDATGAGTLHFSTIDCKVEPYSVSNVLRPIELGVGQGFLVKQGGGLVLANPWAGMTRPIVSDFQRLLQTGSLFLVWGDAQLIAFDSNATELSRFGNNVSSVADLGVGDSFAVADDDGLHSLAVDSTGQGFSFQTVDPDACAMSGTVPDFTDWVLVHSPCSDDTLVAEHVGPTSTTQGVTRVSFAAQADSSTGKVEGLPDDGSSLSQATAFYLTNVDPVTGLGTLFAVKPQGEPLELGTDATLTHTDLLQQSSTWAGTALIEVQNSLGRLVRWSWDGTAETLGENVDLEATLPGILIDFDGHAGDVLGLDASGDPVVEQVGSPPFDNTQDDLDSSLRLEHFDGSVGDLSYLDGLGAEQTVAQRVPPYEYEFLAIVPLPGFAYLGNYDGNAAAGTLFVQNTALGATSTVASGVSDFVGTNYPLPGILYAVPSGANAGIWFARAK